MAALPSSLVTTSVLEAIASVAALVASRALPRAAFASSSIFDAVTAAVLTRSFASSLETFWPVSMALVSFD